MHYPPGVRVTSFVQVVHYRTIKLINCSAEIIIVTRTLVFFFFFRYKCRAAFSAAQSHSGGGEFTVGGGVHDSYTFQCGLVGSFTSPGIDTR